MRHWVHLVFGVAAAFVAAVPAGAEDFGYLGRMTFSTNDTFGDGGDRWQTNGKTLSLMFGREGVEGLPSQPGRLIEFRARAQLITPDDYAAPAAWDRPAAAVLTTTLNTHFETAGYEFSVGAGVAFTGPQTHPFDIQEIIHGIKPWADPFVPDAVLNDQIANGFYPTLLGEAGRPFALSDRVTIRPFVEAQAGVESFARVGADIRIGDGWDGATLLRDATTGFAYHGFDPGARSGLSVVLGADTARVFSSALLPAADGYRLTSQRHRLRGGLLFEHERLSVFYGASWLSPEFAAQPSGQITAATKFKIRF